MIQLFTQKKGAISVFLSVILLPMLIVAFLANDAARIYCAKVVISDAGEMTMNAALAQYNEALKDEYGLIAMDKKPSSMTGDLEIYFKESLNMTDAKDTNKILQLVEQQFEVLDVEASKIYKTNVEKQQILEYMKYRAPVCMADMVLEKLDQIKDNSKTLEAIKAEGEFAEAMQDVQDAFEVAKQELDRLNEIIEQFPKVQEINDELSAAQMDLTRDVTWALLMKTGLKNYKKYDEAKVTENTEEKFATIRDAMYKFYTNIKGTDEGLQKGNLLTDGGATYDKCIDYLEEKNLVDKLGGSQELLNCYDELGVEGDRSEHENLKKNYDAAVEKVTKTFVEYLDAQAKEKIKYHYDILSRWINAASSGEDSAINANEKLAVVKEKLQEAQQKLDNWSEKTEEMPDGSNKQNMKDELKEYKDYFDTTKLDNLCTLVKENENIFHRNVELLRQEKYYNTILATEKPESQVRIYDQKICADLKSRLNAAKQVALYYQNAIQYWQQVSAKQYIHIAFDDSCQIKSIKNDSFYKQLIEWCTIKNNSDTDEKKQEGNKNLEESQKGVEEAKSENGYPTFNWKDAGVELPSYALGLGAITGVVDEEKLTDIPSADVNNGSDRKNIIQKVIASVEEANTFLEGLSAILENAVENLYIAEYAMQMFSYYTINMKDGQPVEGNIESLSGYDLTKNKAYRAETEYILWGKPNSSSNVKATVAVIYATRILFNIIYAMTNSHINDLATIFAEPWMAIAPYLEPIMKFVFKIGLTLMETADDIKDIKNGYGVAILKEKDTWVTLGENPYADNTEGKVTLNYAEYLRIFLNVAIGTRDDKALARIADCIQVNMNDVNLLQMYTMLAIAAKVSNHTTFMRKIADWSGSGWTYNDAYTVNYQSILGY